MAFYKKLFKTIGGKILLLGMVILSVVLCSVLVPVYNTESTALIFLLWILSAAFVFLLFLFVMCIIIIAVSSRNTEISQELKEQVKVLSKRQWKLTAEESVTFYNYITFEFSDGSSEELSVGTSEERGIIKRSIHTDGPYDITHENDTGILTYKLITCRPYKLFAVPLQEKEESRRKFIEFKKD